MINNQNEDHECFRWCLVRQISPVNKNSSKSRNTDKEIEKKLDINSVKFPAHVKDYAKIEKIKQYCH